MSLFKVESIQQIQLNHTSLTNNYYETNFSSDKLGKEKELKDFIENTTKIMNFLKSPNTSKESEKEFINKNNRELAQDPNKYAFYQFLFYKMAFDKKDKYDEVSLNVVK